MSDGYDWYLKTKADILKQTEQTLDRVKKNEVSQRVLFLKSVGTEKFASVNGCTTGTNSSVGFFFNELMVNRLMEYAYQVGRAEGKIPDEDSFKAGWEAAYQDVYTKLGVPECD